MKARLAELFAGLEPGVTEVCLRPALDTLELRAAAPDWRERIADHKLLVGGERPRPGGAAAEVKLVGYRALRELMRTS